MLGLSGLASHFRERSFEGSFLILLAIFLVLAYKNVQRLVDPGLRRDTRGACILRHPASSATGALHRPGGSPPGRRSPRWSRSWSTCAGSDPRSGRGTP